MRYIKKIIIAVLVVILLSASAAAGYVYYMAKNIKVKTISKSDSDLGIAQASTNTQKEREVINIALFGVDTGRQQMEAAHSDTIMILSIDKDNKKVKLSSIMRDSYVSVEGHGNTKITHAYAYGGPELAIKTLNQNFGLDIRDFVTIDFSGMSTIIDMLGGVEIDVNKQEISEINKYGKEVSQIRKDKYIPVTKPGNQILMGDAAVAYARIRHVGNADFERIERQQIVLSNLLARLQKQDPLKYPSIITKTLKYVETSMDTSDIMELGMSVLTWGITPSSLEFVRFPVDGYYKNQMINKISCLTYDIDTAKDQLHKFIYDDIKPVPLKASQQQSTTGSVKASSKVSGSKTTSGKKYKKKQSASTSNSTKESSGTAVSGSAAGGNESPAESGNNNSSETAPAERDNNQTISNQ